MTRRMRRFLFSSRIRLPFLLIVLVFAAGVMPGFTSTYSVNFQVRDEYEGPMPARLMFLGLNENGAIDYQYFPDFDQLNFDPSAGIYWAGSGYAILTPTGNATAELDSGTYIVIATRGPE